MSLDEPGLTTEANHRRHHRGRWLVVALVTIAALVGAVAGFRAWLTRPPERVTVGEAVDRYRSSAPASSESQVPVGLPAPGVYTYLTTGSEWVDALGGDTHDYPTPTTVTVTATACGYRLAWVPLEGRSDTTDLCVARGGVAVAGTSNAHNFFHISQDEHFTCAPGAWWLPPAGTTTWRAECHSEDRTTSRSAHVVGSEPITVGNENRDALHVRFDDVVTGASSGTSTIDLWLDPSTGLPFRETSSTATGNDTVVGHVTFHETLDLVLVAVTPQQ